MFPQGTGELGAERQISNMKPMDRSFQFTGIQQHNAYTKQLGSLIMKKLQMHTLDFDWAPPQRDIWTDDLNDMGLAKDAAERFKQYGTVPDETTGNVAEVEKMNTGIIRRGNVTTSIG
jgi:hypothetical protein